MRFISADKNSFYFNPRPREEGDDVSFNASYIERISIHALVKRATARHTNVIIYHIISIHALVKRATVFTKVRYNIDNISIHALVKRATPDKKILGKQ